MAYTMSIKEIDLPSAYNISYPVGLNMSNMRDDVMLVQALMRLANFCRFSGALGPVEASRNIKVDGYFGPQTKRMITAFEAHVRDTRRLLISDGVFEPSPRDGYTRSGIFYKIIYLNRDAKAASPFGNLYNELPTNPETPAILRGSLTRRN